MMFQFSRLAPQEGYSSDLRQRLIELQGMLVGLMRVVDTLVTNQVRQPQVPQEEGGSRGNPPIIPIVLVVEVDIGI